MAKSTNWPFSPPASCSFRIAMVRSACRFRYIVCPFPGQTPIRRNVTLELVGLVVSAWHAHVLNEGGGQERHQWFCPRTLVPPVLIFRRALHERLRQLGEACRGPRARG